MAHRRPTSVSKLAKQRANRLFHAAVVVAVFAAAGFVLLRATSAATYTAVREVETATVTGEAGQVTSANASAGAAMLFGSKTPEAPYNLVAYTGGDSIALRWDAHVETYELDQAIKQYDVYRNGTFLKSVTPESHDDFSETNGMGTVDLAVTKGTTYSYQVRTITTNGGQSPLSQSLSVLHPTNSFATPTITVDTSKAQDLAGFVNNKLVPSLRIWYPKIAMSTAVPRFTPTATFKIELNTVSPSGAAITSYAYYRYNTGATTLLINPTFLRANQSAHNTPLYAATIMFARLGAPTYPQWAAYGAGYWATFNMQRFNGMVRAPQAGQRYDDTFNGTSQFLEYVRTKYSPDIVKLLHAAIVANNYSDNLFVQATGKTPAQLQAEWQPVPPKGPALIKFSAYANKCLDNNADGGKTNNNAQIWDCNGTGPQQWAAYHQSDGSFAIRSVRYCLHVDSAPTPPVAAMGTCRGTTTSLWKQSANGSLISQSFMPNAYGKCLETPGGNQTAGTQLALATCDGSNKQLFTQIPQ